MYEKFYQLKERPFSLTPDPSFLYFGKNHKRAMDILEYGVVSDAGITVVSGEVGTGKTTLLRALIEKLGDEITVGFITNTQQSFDVLMKWVLLAFGIETNETDHVKLYQMFLQFVAKEQKSGRKALLIIDEAQNLSSVALEDIRMLTNINVNKMPLLQLILVGQPELVKLLSKKELRQFAQRVSADFYLKPLTAEETDQYIRHRLKTAGGQEDLFEDNAIELVYRYSDGIPRIINNLCDMALVYGYSEDESRITLDIVLDVIEDRRVGGLSIREEQRQETRNNWLKLVNEVSKNEVDIKLQD